MKNVRLILESKGDPVYCITPNATVYEALIIMADKNIGALVVLDDERVVGILSERDYARKVILHGKSSKELPVREIMSKTVHSVHPDESIEDCMEKMTDKRIRHLPVIEDGRLAGIISIGDVVKAIIAEQESTIKHLENYITGGAAA
jgi:CBS domain-containing protein